MTRNVVLHGMCIGTVGEKNRRNSQPPPSGHRPIPDVATEVTRRGEVDSGDPLKPGGLAFPLPVVSTTGVRMEAVSRPEGPTPLVGLVGRVMLQLGRQRVEVDSWDECVH